MHRKVSERDSGMGIPFEIGGREYHDNGDRRVTYFNLSKIGLYSQAGSKIPVSYAVGVSYGYANPSRRQGPQVRGEHSKPPDRSVFGRGGGGRDRVSPHHEPGRG